MPSPFEAAWAARRQDLLSRFREMEGFHWLPQAAPFAIIAGVTVADVNAPTEPDPERPQSAISGVFVEKGAILYAHGRSMADSTTRPIVADVPTLIVQLDELLAGIVSRDHLLRVRTGETFEVTKVVPQQFSRAYLHLVRLR